MVFYNVVVNRCFLFFVVNLSVMIGLIRLVEVFGMFVVKVFFMFLKNLLES